MNSDEFLQSTVDRLHIADALAFKDAFPHDPEVGACYRRRTCPLRHLGQTFESPLTLLSVMAEWDCRLVGREALRFFVPNLSARKWDFHVPGYKEAAASMINVLTQCGVTWDLEGDAITAALDAQRPVEVEARTLKAINSWVRYLEPAIAAKSLGPTLYEVVSAFQHTYGKSQASKYLLVPGSNLKVVPIKTTEPADHLSLAEDFHIMRGHIVADGSVQEVRLIIGRFYSDFSSFLEFLNSFYNKRMHCFVGGWCASHLSYYDTISTRLHHLSHSQRQAQGIDSSQSFFVDYGDMYRTYVPKIDQPLLSKWLKKRRNSVSTRRWVVVKDQLIMMHNPGHDRWRRSTALACKEWAFSPMDFRLLAALSSHSSGRLGDAACHSPVKETIFSEEWGLNSVRRSGGVFGPLPDARLWSGIM